MVNINKANKLQQAYATLDKAYNAYMTAHYEYKHVGIVDDLEDAIEALQEAIKECENT